MVADNTFRGRFGIPFLAAVVLSLTASTALSQTRTPPVGGGVTAEKPKTPQQLQDEQVHKRLADAWTALLSGKHAEAIELAEPIATLKDPRYKWCAMEAAHIAARSNFAAGARQSMAKAQQMWAQIERLDTSNATQKRLTIAKALALEAEAQAPNIKPDELAAKVKAAIDLLEPMLKARRWDIATVEAALDASRFYVQAKRFDEAKKTLDYIISYLGVERNIIVMEIPPVLVEPYVKAAQDALKRLKYDRDAGREEFEAAERLRRQSKFAEALRAYTAIARDFADTDYGPRAELHIGDCLVGLRRQAEAIAHWRKFVETKPAGEWRGHALVALIDTFLEEQLDLPDAARYGELARATLPMALADEKAGPSWKACEYDVAIRIGLVSLVTGKSDDAVAAFTRAKAITDKKTVAESLDALIAAAKSGKGVIPEDCRASGGRGHGVAAGEAGQPSDRVALALSMGIIHLVASRLDNADAFFDRVLGTPAVAARLGTPGQPARPAMQGATPAQMAFATFGRGAVLHARRREADAKEAFLASIKAFNSGSWHDEGLYRIASITQDAAASKFAKAPEPAAKPGQPAKPLTPQEREAAAKAEKERLAEFLKAKGEALPYWQELITRYPKSPRVEQAMYNAGVLLCELAEAAPAAQAEKAWKDAAFMLNRFCEFYPKSPLAGDAYVRQMSVATERLFDLDLGSTISQQAVDWARGMTEGKADLPEAPVLGAWCRVERPPTYTSLKPVFYECYQRAGLVAFLRQHREQAIGLFRQADRFDTSPRGISGGETAMARMVSVIQGARDALTPEVLLDSLKDDKQKTGILLADLSLMTFDPQRAGGLYERILAGGWPFARPTPEVESYLLLRIGQALEFQRRHDEAIAYLKRLYEPKYAKYPWAADGIFRVGTWAYNASQDPADAMKHWEHVFTKTPQHPEAERSLFYYALTAMRAREYRRAATAFGEYLNRYPNSRWTQRVEKELLPEVQRLITETRG